MKLSFGKKSYILYKPSKLIQTHRTSPILDKNLPKSPNIINTVSSNFSNPLNLSQPPLCYQLSSNLTYHVAWPHSSSIDRRLTPFYPKWSWLTHLNSSWLNFLNWNAALSTSGLNEVQLGFSMPLFLPICFVCCFPTITVGLSSRPSPSLDRFFPVA